MNSLYADEPGSTGFVSVMRNYAPGVLCGLAGFLSAFTVSLVGLLPVGELILMMVFPWVLIRAAMGRSWPTRLQQLGWFKLLVIMVGIMALGYVVSDLYRGTASNNLVRGWARVAFFAVDLVTITYLVGSSWRRFYVLVIALYLGQAANAVVNGPLNGDWWKFGIGYPITVIGFFVLAGRSSVIQVILAVALGALSLAMGARSLGTICMVAAGLYGFRYARGVMKPVVIVISLASVGLTFFAIKNVVDENQDHSGSNIERQSMIETAGEAFLSSPLVGQGSWFTASAMISRLEARVAQKDPSFHGYSEEEVRKISIHSQLLAALAEAGLLGGAFFFCLAVLLLKTLRSLMNYYMPHRAFLFYLVLSGLWNLCMSPFSGVARVEITLGVCACLLVILQRLGEMPEDFRE